MANNNATTLLCSAVNGATAIDMRATSVKFEINLNVNTQPYPDRTDPGEVDEAGVGPFFFTLNGTIDRDDTGSVTDEDAVLTGTTAATLAHRGIVPGTVVVTPNGGGSAYTETTDYTINYSAGTIVRTAGSTMPSGYTFDVDYTHFTDNRVTFALLEELSVSRRVMKFKHDAFTNEAYQATPWKNTDGTINVRITKILGGNTTREEDGHIIPYSMTLAPTEEAYA